MKPVVKHVWLVLMPGHIHGWEIVRGICRFARHRRWVITFCDPRKPPRQDSLRKAKIDGMIGLLNHHRYLDVIRQRRLAAVNMTRNSHVGRLPCVLVDDYQCGRMAAEYFLSRGFTNFGYLRAEPMVPIPRKVQPHANYTSERERGFRQRLEQAATDFCYFPLRAGVLTRANDAMHGKPIKSSDLQWLLDLPKPIAVFAAYDPVAFDLANECQLAGVRIPEQVAILGVHNGQILCETANPPLSSIDTASEQRGYVAAQMLDDQFSGRRDPTRTVIFPPVGVVSRLSTDVIAAKNPIVADALHYIRDNLGQGVNVSQVIDHLGVSRRHLERCFQEVLQRSPLDEIHRLRVALAMDLLASTTLSMAEVAMQSGYGRPDRMSKAIRAATGKTPLACRRLYKDR